jgi:2'-5' RNA ligase
VSQDPAGDVRSFVAVEIPDAIRSEVGRLQQDLKRSAEGVRWVRPDRMHLTLVFLGEVENDYAEPAAGPLAEACGEHGAFEAALGGLGAFPNPSRARVAWVGMKQGGDALVRLQASVSRALEGMGYQPERRRFSPHLTLGRLRMPGDVSRLVGRDFSGTRFTVERVTLFKSVLRPEGPQYTRLADFPLAQPA